MPDTAGYLFIGAVAAIVTFVTTPIVTRLAHRVGWVVQPDERRVHKVATPDVGGIALLVGILAALLLASLMDRFDPLFNGNSETLGVVIAAPSSVPGRPSLRAYPDPPPLDRRENGRRAGMQTC